MKQLNEAVACTNALNAEICALPSAHSKVGASVIERLSICPGAVRVCTGLPNPSSIHSATGTVAHTIGAQVLSNKPTCKLGDVVEQDGYKVKVTQEMLDAVQVYVDHVQSLVPRAGDILLVEQGFHLKDLHPDLYGTADAVVWWPVEKHLHVIDYKHGAGIGVEVTGNKQTKYYALGALLQTGFCARKVTMTIVQPRFEREDGAVRSETFDAFELLEWAADLLDIVKRTEDPAAPLVPGDHCYDTFCPARLPDACDPGEPICPALKAHKQEMAALAFTPVASYDPVKLKKALDGRALLRAMLKSLDEFAYAEAMAGRLPAEVGYKLVEKRANRKWVDEDLAAAALQGSGLLSTQIYETPQLKSPAQVEKLVGKKGFKAIESDYVTKESSGFTLVPVDDPRQPVRILDAAAEFTGVPVITEVTDAK